MSAPPRDRWPLEREQLRSFDFPLALGAWHNIVGASANGHEVVRFDTEVAPPHSERPCRPWRHSGPSDAGCPISRFNPRCLAVPSLTGWGKALIFLVPIFLGTTSLRVAMRQGPCLLHSRVPRIFEGWERFDSNKNWHLQKRGEWVIVCRKGEGDEPDERQKSSVTWKPAQRNKEPPVAAIPTQYSRDHADARCLRVFRFRQRPSKRLFSSPP